MESRTLLNKSIAGLPRQLNQMLGNIASGDNGAINKLETALKKTKFGSKLVNADIFGNTLGGWLQTLAGKAYIDDDTVYSQFFESTDMMPKSDTSYFLKSDDERIDDMLKILDSM